MDVTVPTVTVGSTDADITTGYQVVALDLSTSTNLYYDGTGSAWPPGGEYTIVLDAPEGTNVIGGGIALNSASYTVTSWYANGPLPDGSGWQFSGTFHGGPTSGSWGTLYAICMAV